MSDPEFLMACALVASGRYPSACNDALWAEAARVLAARPPKADAVADASMRRLMPKYARLNDLVQSAIPGLNGGTLSADRIREITDLSNEIEAELP